MASEPRHGRDDRDDDFEPVEDPTLDELFDEANVSPPSADGDNGLFPLTREAFAQAVIRRVRGKFPLVKIGRAKHQPFAVRVNGHVASLENLYRISRLKPGDLQHQVERWAVELLRAGEGTPDRSADWEAIKDRVLPMILPADAKGEAASDAAAMDAALNPPGLADATSPLISGKPRGIDALITQPLVPGLRTGYVIDGDRTIAYIPWEALGRWDLDVEHLHERAMANLVERSQTMNAHAAQGEDEEINLILFQTLDGFDASRLLLPNLHDRLRRHLGSPFVAAVPNRDILLCFRNDPDTVEGLRGQIKHDHRTMPHQVTDRLLLVTADGIALYD